MIKIVIVDDEKMIRDGLVNTMPWEQMRIKVVGSAGDGEKALKIVREQKPHIILTDIRMPIMDGIELLRVVKGEMPGINVIMLSGYDEFSYVQQAIKYGAVDYLMKPVIAEELEDVIMKVKKNLNSEINKDFQRLKINKAIETELGQFLNAAGLGYKEDAFIYLKNIYKKEILNNVTIAQHKILCIQIVDSLMHLLKKDGVQLQKESISEAETLDILLVDFTKVEEIKKWLFGFMNKIIIFVEGYRSNNSSHVIKKALDYIENHFKEELPIEKVAEAACLSANYFSHIFKKERGESFKDCLNRLRIQEAKNILSTSLYKVYEVSDMVGYNDYKYFSSVFKKHVGISPAHYCGNNK